MDSFMNTGFKYQELLNITDVQQIMDAFVALATSPADPSQGWIPWTAGPDAGEYQSPGAQDRIRFLFTRVAAHQMTCRVKSTRGITLGTRGIQMPTTNAWTVRLFVGDNHAAIDAWGHSALPEGIWAGTLDVSPDIWGANYNCTTWFGGSRDGNWYKQYDNAGYVAIQDGDVAPSGGTATRVGLFASQQSGTQGQRHLSGGWVYRPREIWAKVRGDEGIYGNMHYIGRAYQMLMAPDKIPYGSRIYVPIDTGTLAEFMVLGAPTSYNSWRLAVRSA
jgi:hypothetical protein